MSLNRVTLKQIADKAGVHPTTVSMALRNHPRIPGATRERLKELAEKMGYVPDPMLSSLNAYRHEKTPRRFLGKIAWLNVNIDPDWPKKTFIREYFEGASQRAKSLGYELEVFNAHPQRIPTRRLQQILISRSILGIIIAPLQRNYPEAVGTLNLEWDKFCSIALGYTLESPEINRVTTNHYHGVTEMLRNLHKSGYRRPALFLSRVNNARISRLWEAGYLVGMRTIYEKKDFPVALFEAHQDKNEVFREWYQTCNPDVVIAQDFESVRTCFETLAIRSPEDCGLALLEDHHKGDIPCIDQRNTEIGGSAVSLLVGAMQRHEYGIPQTPNVTMIEGFWKAGKTTAGSVARIFGAS